jgi:hypothetical protein
MLKSSQAFGPKILAAPTLRKLGLDVLERSLGSPAMAESLNRCANFLFNPPALQEELVSSFPHLRQVVLSGSFEERLIFLQHQNLSWIAANLAARPFNEIALPEVIASELQVKNPEDYVSACEISPGCLFRLTRPRIQLISLSHTDNFPLPRFPLCISDLARAVRRGLQGEVRLADMQLGISIADFVTEVGFYQPDIIGISATFGQHDLLEELIDSIVMIDSRALVVFGGSLCALNAARLLERYPHSLVARGAGEETMRDIVEYWHGDRTLQEVRGIQWLSEGRLQNSKIPSHDTSGGFLPELDLLEKTLESRGVMQLESSRGCTHACSFCPREHKGVWAGDDAERMRIVLSAVSEIFDERAAVARKIFLVDEEFIGRDSEGRGLQRAREVATEIWSRGFRWETSARVDQVYRPDRDKDWHVERLSFWTWLREHGLDRCLFGVESGVDSVLKRFNKRVTPRQNVLALRLLSACNVPIRCTYITFDHLMSFSELKESYQFQGREDLILQSLASWSFDDLFEAVHDDAFATKHAAKSPFYDHITYMLVSMECLIGSPYLTKVMEVGLAREEMPSMGRRNAEFRDPTIGAMSRCSQLWIDRNFSFDYLLKSLEKTTGGQERSTLRSIRILLKRHSYNLLGSFLELPQKSGLAIQSATLLEVMAHRFSELVAEVEILCQAGGASMSPDTTDRLLREFRVWKSRESWELINH